jgi:error-prone DNA polymerase
MAKALGYDRDAQDAMARRIGPWARLSSLRGQRQVPAAAGKGDDEGDEVPELVVELAREVEHLPRHLGIHSGGMVICDRPVGEVCPIERARMADRTVLQWDKDDCAAVGLVKFDLLGLGMLSALHNCFDLLRETASIPGDLASIPREDPEVYEMLCRADSVGVFQVESRAQMATLPRLEPRRFYDLVVEVALIRPGPIQGGSVHPYIRRRKKQEEATYLHPSLEPALEKTLGIPLFQEQLMQIVMDAAGFSAAEADQLRQAMGSKRSRERMERLYQRFLDGTAEKGIDSETAERIWEKLAAFASYGFPESHSVSFAYLVYASSWLKRYFPAAFCAGLLNAQPMGFYSPHSLVQDARRHGVEVRTPDLNVSGAKATLEGGWEPVTVSRQHPESGVFVIPASARAGAEPAQWGRTGPAVRMGLSSVRSLKEEIAERIVAVRDQDGAFSSPEDLVRRVPGLSVFQMEALATAGAFGCFGLDRREALWVAGASAGALAGAVQGRLPGIVCGAEAPPLPEMSPAEESQADLWATGVSPEGHPTRFVRARLDELGVAPAEQLVHLPSGQQVTVAGVVTHRQRPATASGTTFVNLEDETGLVNVVVSKGCWEHHRRVLLEVPALVVRGRLERLDNAISVVAHRVEPLPVTATVPSRDFR